MTHPTPEARGGTTSSLPRAMRPGRPSFNCMFYIPRLLYVSRETLMQISNSCLYTIEKFSISNSLVSVVQRLKETRAALSCRRPSTVLPAVRKCH